MQHLNMSCGVGIALLEMEPNRDKKQEVLSFIYSA